MTAPRAGNPVVRWFASRPLFAPRRLAGIDIARGLAVIGMFAAHLLVATLDWDWNDTDTWLAVVNGRSSILFATLAGVSIGIVTGGTRHPVGPARDEARWKLVIRAILLGIIGLLLISTDVPVFVILTAYALLFFCALPFVTARVSTLLIWAGAIVLVMPVVVAWIRSQPWWSTEQGTFASDLLGLEYPFLLWLAFVLAGLAVARAGLARLRTQLVMLAAGTAAAVVGYGLSLVPSPFTGDVTAAWGVAPHSTGIPEAIGSGGFAIAVIAACLLLCRLPFIGILLLPIRATGSMPLTAYTGHLVLWIAMAEPLVGGVGDYWGFIDTEPFWPITLTVVIACTIWALAIGKGPLEWVIDQCARLAVRPPPPPVTHDAPLQPR